LFVGHISPFWSAISNVVPYMHINMKSLVGTGQNILFWFDIWYGEILFYIQFPNLFAKAKSPLTLTVVQVWNLGNFNVPLTRGASLLLRAEKAHVHSIMVDLSVNFVGNDSCVWSLDTKGIFLVRSMYLFFMNSGCINYSMNCLWELKLPLKVCCFFWLVVQNKIFTTDNLSRKGWIGPLSCVFCHVNESVNHLFFACPFMSDFWGAFNICNIQQIRLKLTSLNDLWDSALHLSGLDRRFTLSVIAVIFLGLME
jgi:zinc-binding in reverse transcriptase